MKKCDNCKKETEKRYFHEMRLPNVVIKKNKLPETLDRIIEDISKDKVSTFDMWICAECKSEFQKSRMNAYNIRDHAIKKQRKRYEEKGDVEDLK